jgi:hypothetical protein
VVDEKGRGQDGQPAGGEQGIQSQSSEGAVDAACLRAKLRQKEEALSYWSAYSREADGKRDWVEHDPDYDILRDDPRFQNLRAKLK